MISDQSCLEFSTGSGEWLCRDVSLSRIIAISSYALAVDS